MDYKLLKKLAGEGGERALKALSKPQRYVSQKAAEAVGMKPADSSEANFQNLADVAGDALGVPRDSTLGNVAKAGVVAGAEIFADPLGLLPIGKIARGVKALKPLATIMGRTGAASHAVESAVKQAPKAAHEIRAAAAVQQNKAKAMQQAVDLISEKRAAVERAAKRQAENAALAAQQKAPKDSVLQGMRDPGLITNETSRATKTIEAQTDALQRAYTKKP